MKEVFKTVTLVFLCLAILSPASAQEVYYDIYTASDTTIGSTTIDGDFIVAKPGYSNDELSLSGSFTGWGNLNSYSDVTATMTFTWHDDDWNWTGGSSIYPDMNNFDLTDFYPDLAIVSLDGATAFQNVEVGVLNSTDASVYTYTLPDLSILEDGELNYLIQAGLNSGARTDFIVDSVSLSINGTPSAVPVPGALYLLGGGLVWLLGIRRNIG